PPMVMLNAVKHLKMYCREAVPPYLQWSGARYGPGACRACVYTACCTPSTTQMERYSPAQRLV
ncbi:MAG: hypothetical protein ACQETP_11590, partial [Bacteroidota bacterium]